MYDAARFASLGGRAHSVAATQGDRSQMLGEHYRSVGRNLSSERSDGAPGSGGIPKFFQRGAAAE